MIFRTDAGSGFQFQNVETVAFTEHCVDTALDTDGRGVTFQFELCVLEQFRVPIDEFLERARVPQNIGSKRVFIQA